MTRQNPEVERLQREVDVLRRENERLRAAPDPYPVSGCGADMCEVERPQGVHVVGRCRCDEQTLRWALRWHKRYVAHLRSCFAQAVGDVEARMREVER